MAWEIYVYAEQCSVMQRIAAMTQRVPTRPGRMYDEWCKLMRSTADGVVVGVAYECLCCYCICAALDAMCIKRAGVNVARKSLFTSCWQRKFIKTRKLTEVFEGEIIGCKW